MKLYQIADLEQLTGIKAHTIRIWEKRYALIEPTRTATNRRQYDQAQVKKLLNISALLMEGHRISKIAELEDKELSRKIFEMQDQGEQNAVCRSFINDLTVAMLNFNEAAFEKTFSQAVARFGVFDAVLRVFYPLLRKVGILWACDHAMPVQEHFASGIIRRKLIAATDQLPQANRKKKKFLLFLPPGEAHEIGLLFSNYLLRSRGCETIYLGANVPYENLEAVIKHTGADYLLTSFVNNRNPEDVSQQISRNLKFTGVKVLVCGPAETLRQLKKQKQVEVLLSPEAILAYLK
jgi:DNA-binding transcriptional MerR regulator